MARIVVVALVCALALTGCGARLDDDASVEKALPTAKDMPGYSASGGIFTVLKDPKGHHISRTVLTGDKLDVACAQYRKQGDTWACDGLRGLGVASYQYNLDVNSRVCSFVLGFRSSGAAKNAWEQAVAQTRKELKHWEDKDKEYPTYGEESLTLNAETGTDVVMRKGSVVAIITSHNANGYQVKDDPLLRDRAPDPIGTWAKVQQKRIDQALR